MEIWLARDHFNLEDPWEHVDFQVRSVYDVVAGQGWRLTFPQQTLCELWLISEGEVCVHIGQKSATLRSPSIALLTAGQPRDTWHTSGEKLSITGFCFDATLFGALNFVELLDLPIAPEVNPDIFDTYLSRMLLESRTKSSGYALAIHGLGQLAFVELMRALKIEETPRIREKLRLAQSQELMAVVQFVANHFDSPLSIEQMAEIAHLSPKHFAKKFTETLGISPLDYLRKFRLNQARNLLATTDFTAGRIARDCSFTDGAYFSRIFKQEFGQTPNDFRRQIHTSSN
jgi:AraC family transcriptional regulator of arabinose operon